MPKVKKRKRKWYTIVNGSLLRVRSTTHFGAMQKIRAQVNG